MTEARAKFDVSGRVACVTGVDSGLGQRAAITLAAAGALVVGVARNAEASGSWTDAAGASIAFVAADLSQRQEIGEIAARVAEAWSRDGINANAIGPSCFSTEQMAQEPLQHEYAAESAAQTCVGRTGTLADIDGPLLFLCSDASAFVTGQVLMVDGGCSAK